VQGTSKTLVDAKAKTLGFISFMQLCQRNVSAKKSDKFYWRNKCDVTDADVFVTADHLSKMASDLNDRF
jgi:hypothetical protein